MRDRPPRIRTVHIDELDAKGFGAGPVNTEGRLSIPFTAPGDAVEVEKRRKGQGRLLRLLEPSPNRIAPTCRHFGACGGCLWQHIAYEDQLEHKRRSVERLLIRRELDYDASRLPITPSPHFGYRNRMDFVWRFDGRFGLRELGRWYSIIQLEECRLIAPEATEIAFEINRRAHAMGLRYRDQKKRIPGLRYVIMRRGVFTGRMMALIVSDEMEIPASLYEGLPLDSVYQLINDNLENDGSDGRPVHLSGETTLRERVLNREFEIGPRSFFQPNPAVAAQMALHVRREFEARPGRRLLDLYCGVGFFSAMLADRFERALGVEIEAEAVNLARRNVPETNAEFVCMEAENSSDLDASGFDALLIDPPRNGLHPKTLKWILNQNFERIVYVSCNPKRGCEDIGLMKSHYRIADAELFDQFPQTPHVELIATLVRR
ncbi:MAG: 23S rRNA (uracil(1939)-C(5))-methyltransferase RlmD [bacterium]|nr:23S rRNA (uracil(1939)-C(5))-methyltransferase RlmD [bacterium]